ncbi:MAG: DUF998 domain-containing protein [Anaerolineae bacterium]
MLMELLTPFNGINNERTNYGLFALLMFSAALLLIAPFFMPVDYSWVSQTTSESAAQGVPNAWIARLGFITFGFSVISLAIHKRSAWAISAVWLHIIFGVLMTATAAFSHHHWDPSMPLDPIEDALHSITATVMGFAFSFGILALLLQKLWQKETDYIFDIVAISVATFIPLGMLFWPNYAGIAQRFMFLVAYAWYGREALNDHTCDDR